MPCLIHGSTLPHLQSKGWSYLFLAVDLTGFRKVRSKSALHGAFAHVIGLAMVCGYCLLGRTYLVACSCCPRSWVLSIADPCIVVSSRRHSARRSRWDA